MRVDSEETEWDDGLFLLYRGEPFTGEVEERDHAGRLAALNTYVNGREDGLSRSWHPNGQLKSEVMSRMGRAVGTARRWHANGQLAAEKVFADNDGLVEIREWSEDGTPIERPRRSG